MNDTSRDVAVRVATRHRQMTPLERWQIASAMFETARAIIDSSLPAHLPQRQRRLALARRFYGKELPQAALDAFAQYESVRGGG